MMKVYINELDLGIAAIRKGKNLKIVVFDLNDGEASVEIYENGVTKSYDIEEFSDEILKLLEEANDIISNDLEEMLDEMPEEIKAIMISENLLSNEET